MRVLLHIERVTFPAIFNIHGYRILYLLISQIYSNLCSFNRCVALPNKYLTRLTNFNLWSKYIARHISISEPFFPLFPCINNLRKSIEIVV